VVPHQQHINELVLNGQTCLVRSARFTTRLFEANKNTGGVVFPRLDRNRQLKRARTSQ